MIHNGTHQFFYWQDSNTLFYSHQNIKQKGINLIRTFLHYFSILYSVNNYK